jgi:hypothetical protein
MDRTSILVTQGKASVVHFFRVKQNECSAQTGAVQGCRYFNRSTDMASKKPMATTGPVAAAMLGLAASAGPSSAATVDEISYASEVNTCIAEIRDHLDYRDASRVRHDVVIVKRRLVGYAIRIDTRIFPELGEQAVREYATFCIANGDHKPLKFEISETDAGI